mmetsp:Transcript_106268/g.310692  ORF Transcript_106268/g.310692 Transcript_106268/m.310692 type:complete len:83 (-) Transcript_106268:93-341(-)
MASGQEFGGVLGRGDDADDFRPQRHNSSSVRRGAESREEEAKTQSCLQLIQACRNELHLRSLCTASVPGCVRHLRSGGLPRA